MWTDLRRPTVWRASLIGAAALGICIATLAVAQNAAAPVSATSRSVVIDAVDSTGNAATLKSWRNVYGSSARTKAETRQLEIAVRNMSGTLPGDFNVEWFFVGRPAAGTRRFLYDKGSRRISLKPGAFEKFEVESKELSNYRYHSVSSGYVYRSGDRADGWIVRVKVGDDVVRTKASSPQLEELEKNKDQFERFVKDGRK
jgi:hypothetical protein